MRRSGVGRGAEGWRTRDRIRRRGSWTPRARFRRSSGIPRSSPPPPPAWPPPRDPARWLGSEKRKTSAEGGVDGESIGEGVRLERGRGVENARARGVARAGRERDEESRVSRAPRSRRCAGRSAARAEAAAGEARDTDDRVGPRERKKKVGDRALGIARTSSSLRRLGGGSAALPSSKRASRTSSSFSEVSSSIAAASSAAALASAFSRFRSSSRSRFVAAASLALPVGERLSWCFLCFSYASSHFW